MGLISEFLEAWDVKDREKIDKIMANDLASVRHQSGKIFAKSNMMEMFGQESPSTVSRTRRVIYENEEIAVVHQFIDYQSGDKEALMQVFTINEGKVTKMETGATPLE